MGVTVYGVNPASTISLIMERGRRLQEGREVSDGRKAALIVEGGAMRGVISCAALMALERAQAAARRRAQIFSRRRMVDEYLGLYAELLGSAHVRGHAA